MEKGFHQPALAKLAIEYLVHNQEGVYVDCTLGGGGHGYAILERTSPRAFLIGIDADPEAIEYAAQRLSRFSNKYLQQAFFDQLEVVLHEAGKHPVDGVLYDLGISSFQVDEERRGFSYQSEGPLDMRFDPRQKVSAAVVLNGYSQEDLGRIIREFGEERHWRAIAREISRRRETAEFRTAGDLAAIVRSVVGERFLNKSLARVFQAIRIEVNRELERLRASLEAAFQVLKQGGRLVVISYHSLEDRIVKEFFREKYQSCVCPPELPACVCNKVRELEILTRRPLSPDEEEIRANPRARSAKLRAAEKIVPYREGQE